MKGSAADGIALAGFAFCVLLLLIAMLVTTGGAALPFTGGQCGDAALGCLLVACIAFLRARMTELD